MLIVQCLPIHFVLCTTFVFNPRYTQSLAFTSRSKWCVLFDNLKRARPYVGGGHRKKMVVPMSYSWILGEYINENQMDLEKIAWILRNNFM